MREPKEIREKQSARFETRAVHAGERRAPCRDVTDEEDLTTPSGSTNRSFYSISTPIYLSTTFAHETVEQTDRVLGGEEPGYSYARYGNPTITAFEEAVASLEGGGRAFAFASGMAAMHGALMAAEVGNGARFWRPSSSTVPPPRYWSRSSARVGPRRASSTPLTSRRSRRRSRS